ncbi:hypothetical protein Poly51_58190 [Rubripirellula tenax]|uniref:Uncharacterized protein n=1 Tax=Rubripirellula tenax TaxID=2528015 RepID=A0A5C6E4Z6_9BACT|nr:hypothetical protein [Rubripirellula tenax]TWU44753.1 hypothetical protein Poly51_58190 [Rubripirellula tenax]
MLHHSGNMSPIFISRGWHQSWVLFVLAIMWLITGVAWLGIQWPMILVVTTGPAAVLLLLAWASRRQAFKEQQVLDAARTGSVVFRWDLTGKQADWFRQSRRNRCRRKLLFWAVLPMIAGCLLAALVGFYNLLQGVSVGHSIKMAGVLAAVTFVATGIIAAAFWIWTLPGLRTLNHHDLPVLFLSDSIRVGDEVLHLSLWKRSREFTVTAIDDFFLMTLKFTSTYNDGNGFRSVVTRTLEIPIPFECEDQADEIAETYRLVRHA